MRGLYSVILIIACIGCIDPYEPHLNPNDLNMLVIDGSISIDGTASVLLNRSIDMNTSSLLNPKESNATVAIRSSSGEVYSLTESKPGTYTASGLDVNSEDQFTLSIVTSSGYRYESDQVEVYPTPPIDSIHFVVAPNGQNLQILVDANDPDPDAIGYYLWDCTETYQYRAQVHSPYKLVNRVAIQRLPEEEIFTCWKDAIVPSTTYSTNKLTENRISGIPIVSIEKFSKKISVRYSVLVKQRAISEAEFRFRSQLKNTNELTGSIFSILPGSVTGNVHSIGNPNEYVLGYFRAQDLKQRLFFIDFDDLPSAFQTQRQIKCDFENTCRTDEPPAGPSNCVNITNLGLNAVITGVVTNAVQEQVSVEFTSSECADCRSWGGTTTKPPFW